MLWVPPIEINRSDEPPRAEGQRQDILAGRPSSVGGPGRWRVCFPAGRAHSSRGIMMRRQCFLSAVAAYAMILAFAGPAGAVIRFHYSDEEIVTRSELIIV